jgi:hypothetical protein
MAFKKGQVANPAGRPAGTRNRLQSAFLQDLLQAWERDGKDALKLMVREAPVKFVQVAAGLMPKEVALDVAGPLSDMSDQDLESTLEAIRQLRAKTIEGVTADIEMPRLKVIAKRED